MWKWLNSGSFATCTLLEVYRRFWTSNRLHGAEGRHLYNRRLSDSDMNKMRVFEVMFANKQKMSLIGWFSPPARVFSGQLHMKDDCHCALRSKGRLCHIVWGAISRRCAFCWNISVPPTAWGPHLDVTGGPMYRADPLWPPPQSLCGMRPAQAPVPHVSV